MQDCILKGVVLKAIDWKEKDKLVTLITPERGLTTINIRGVRQQKSKLKFATQPMCFAEFCLTGNGEILTCTGASEIESFFAVTNNYDDMVLAGATLEMVYSIAQKEPSVDLFVLLVRTLGCLCDNQLNHDLVFLKFCEELFKISGYAQNFDTCKNCQQKLQNANLDFSSGAIVCDDCSSQNAQHISLSAFNILKFLNDFSFEQLSKVVATPSQIAECKQLMIKNFNFLFDKRLKSIKV